MKRLILFCFLVLLLSIAPRGGRLEVAAYPYKFIDGESSAFYMEGADASPRIVALFLDQLKGSESFHDREIGYVVLAGKHENIPKVHAFLQQVKGLMKEKGVTFFVYGSWERKSPIDIVRW